jgi:hypothetical protein
MQIIRFRLELSDSGHFVRFLRLGICCRRKYRKVNFVQSGHLAGYLDGE